MSTVSLHQRAKEIFLAALARPAVERPAFLNDVCGPDATLREEVNSLLAFHDEHTGESGLHLAGVLSGKGEPLPEPFASGQVFAQRYRMITRIGKGGMGDVWRAEDLVLGTEVALKLLLSSGSQTARARILNEVRVARLITHPAVCRVFDVGEAEGRIFFSMELVRGEDLASLLRRVGRLPSEKVLDIGRRLTAGLAAAHAQGVLHRDLKPANILMDHDGLVRITDFGIAIPRSDPSAHRLTGTPGYMAPEQMVLGSTLTERTDLYALGLVLYELVVGRHPFHRPEDALHPAPPSTLVPNVDPRLERAIMQALSSDPQHRPESATALGEMLEDPSKSSALVRLTRPGVLTSVAIALLATVGCWAFGLLTSLAFNATLGRVEGFEHESLFELWRFGQQALFVPALVMFTAGLALIAVRPLCLPLKRCVPRRLSRARNGVLGQLIITAQLAVALVLCWRFSDILTAVMVRVNDAPLSSLAPLGPDVEMSNERAMFTIYVSTAILLMVLVWRLVLKRDRVEFGQIPPATIAAGGFVILLLLLILLVPYRTLYLNKKERIEFDSARCYVTGTRPGDLLLYCPDVSPPKNRIVSATDARLRRSNVIESIFTRAN